MLVIAVNALCSVAGQISSTFFNNYMTQLQGLGADVAVLAANSPNEPFQIQQKYKYHSGHRAWQPMAAFRVATGSDII